MPFATAPLSPLELVLAIGARDGERPVLGPLDLVRSTDSPRSAGT